MMLAAPLGSRRADTAAWTAPAEGEVHLWTARLDALAGDLEPTVRTLPEDERAAAARMRSPHRRRQYVIARAVLRSLLGRYLEPAAAALPFRYAEGGKPALVDPAVALQFNLAHSGDVVVVALASSDPVGVDIERIRPVAHLATIARTYFTARERAWLDSLEEGERSEGFLLLWTSKEAVAKASGKGISGGWTDFEVIAGPGGAAVVRPTGSDASSWHLIRPRAAPGYHIAVAVPRAGTAARTFEWNPRIAST